MSSINCAVWTASPGSLEEGKTPQGSWQRLGSMFQVRDFFDFWHFEDGALAFLT